MYALIVAGGEGQRLRPYTEDRPKGMVSLNGKPLLEYQMGWLRNNGVTNVIILCGYKAGVIMDHFHDGEGFGLQIEYGIEKSPLGRGGALKLGFSMLPPTEELVVGANGDNINDQRLGPMIEFHQENRALATIMLTRLRSPYGIATVRENGQITGFEEKPLLPHWLNAGVYVFSRPVFSAFPDKGDHEDTTFPELARQGRLFGYKSDASWRTVDTVKDLLEASQELKETH
jgi:NDP-sugar pyrophosphorylase family protein